MPIYLLETTEHAIHMDHPTFKKVVLASSVSSARRLAAADCLGMEDYDAPKNWIDSKRSICVELNRRQFGGVICKEYI
jgi:hypothetical protein